MRRTAANVIVGLGALLVATTSFAASPTLDKIKERKEIALGYRDSSVPFSYLDANQKPIGFSMDLCTKIVEKVKQVVQMPNLDVKYVAVNSSNRIPLVKNGTVDIECGGTANNLQRQKEVAFTVATFVSQPKWMVKKSNNINDTNGLKGKVVVVTQGSNAVGFAKEANEKGKLDLKIVQAKDHAESMLMLESDRAYAFLEDDILLAGKKAEAKDPTNLKFLPESYDIIYYGLMLPKGDAEFKGLVDKVITDLMASGEFNKIYYKWFQNPLPPNGVNLIFPMGEELTKRVKNPSDKVNN